ncbi:hypothetical protein [Hydrogenophaga sp. BPS33]|uniref:hypothetical protein n=1 Tax=Hydrogenophaga sp. BPS33 TaxID=2651974 RepID=UPI0013203B6A|nr:hypothetical protein [Hydrogenophaga sp. BPS33]QHE83378.1 hypothetical protein F9K07_00020 [Hydrogenophaga sp. BPS33]
MRLIISQFLRTLRERDEFDRLLPDLLLAMGYVPLAKPQTGVRQFGVDLAAVGKSPVDGIEELLLLVIKQGDLGRRDWDNGEPTSVRPSLNEVLDVYLTKLVAPEHAGLRKTIVLATTGDLKQDVETNWTGFKEQNSARASFDFWGADRVSHLVERFMLDENLFAPSDRADLRKSLALASDSEYDFRDLNRMLLRQLGLTADGKLQMPSLDTKALQKAFRRIHLAAQICTRWAQAEGDSRQALWISERTLLWAWHRLQLTDPNERPKLHATIAGMWHSYTEAAARYFDVIRPHLEVRDGMAGYGSEGAAFAVVLFEHIGLIAAIGLACRMEPANGAEAVATIESNVAEIADGLCALIKNHEASASPRLDGHIIDATLAVIFLVLAGRHDEAKGWVAEMAKRLDYCFQTESKFPVSTDSLEDLVELEVSPKDSKLTEKLMSTSWSLATIAALCVIFKLDDHYAALARGATGPYDKVCAQLWHPTKEWPESWYFGDALDQGEAEAPYALLSSTADMRLRMKQFLEQPEFDWVESSPTRKVGLWALDFVACRHFRMPVPASAWYRFGNENPVDTNVAQVSVAR